MRKVPFLFVLFIHFAAICSCLPDTGTLVVRAEGGRTEPGSSFSCDLSYVGGRRAMTSNDGTFVFEGLKAGQYKALVKSTDADGKTVLAGSGSIGLLPGESREIAIELSKIEERKDMRLLVLGLAGHPEASWDLLLVDERTGETVLERYGIRDEEIFLEKVPYGEYELYIIAREGEDILFEHRSTFPVDFDSSPALEVAEEGFPPSIVLDTQCSEPILAKIDAKGKDGGEKAELSVVFSCLPDGIESSDVEINNMK